MLAHVGAEEEGFQLSFALDVDEAAALAGVAQPLQHHRRLLRHLQGGGAAHIHQVSTTSVGRITLHKQYDGSVVQFNEGSF